MSFKRIKYQWIALVCAVLIALFFYFVYPHHLLFSEQFNLFLLSTDFFLGFFQKPAWLASYIGSFFVSFFYFKWTMGLLMGALFLMIWFVSFVLFKNQQNTQLAAAWALVPALVNAALHTHLLHSPVMAFSVVIAMLLVILMLNLKMGWLPKCLLSLPVMVLAYWLAGTGAIIIPFVYFIFDGSLFRYRFAKTLVMLLVFTATALLSRWHFALDEFNALTFPSLISYSLLFPLSLIVAAAGHRYLGYLPSRMQLIRHLSPLVVAVMLVGVVLIQCMNLSWEKVLKLDYLYSKGQHQKIIGLAGNNKPQNRMASYYNNMALAAEGEIGNRLMDFYQPATHGLFIEVNQYSTWQLIMFSNEAFFLVGDMNLAQHSAMLGMTFSPYQRSSRMIRRLAEINMVNHDYPGAMKYLRLLQHTIFHKKWANSMVEAIECNRLPGYIAHKQGLLPSGNLLRKSSDHQNSLAFFVDANPANILALDYLLCYHILNKNLKQFKYIYDTYAVHVGRPLFEVYAQALLVELFRLKEDFSVLANYGISSGQLNGFTAYTNDYQQHHTDMEIMKEKYGNTYWFYYHFATIQSP